MNRDLFLVAFSLFFWGIGEGMFSYFQSIYLAQLGASPLLIGTILGVMGIAILIFQIPAGLLSDKLGSRPLMWASWMFGALSAGVMAFAQSLLVFVIGMLMYGLTSFVLAPMNSYIAARRGKWSVGRALTFTNALFNFGMVIGPSVGGWIGETLGLPIIYKISACLFVVSTILVLFVSPVPAEVHHSAHQSFKVLRNNRPFLLLIFLAFLITTATYLPQPLSSNFLEQVRGLDLSQIGQMGSIGSLGTALAAVFLGHLSPFAGILIGQGMMAAFSIILWNTSLPLLLAIGYLFIGGYRLYRSMMLAAVRDIVDIGQTGLAFGVLETANALALMLAPFLAGLVYSRDPILIYPFSLIVILVVGLIFLFIIPRLSNQPINPPSLSDSEE